MGKHTYKIIFCALLLMGISTIAKAQIKSSQDIEYKLKAAFLYNFIKFVDWPEKKLANNNEQIVIGIIGKNTFGDAFEPVKDKKVKGQEAIVKYYKSFSELEKNTDDLNKTADELKKCHLLFVCSSEKDKLIDIIDIVKNDNVLTVGETAEFLKAGGIINFLLEDNKVRFEISLIAARQSKLTIRSQLLRLATRVIDDENK